MTYADPAFSSSMPGPMIPDQRPQRLRTAVRMLAGLSLISFLSVAVAPALLGEAAADAPLEPTATPSIVVAAASNRTGDAASLSQAVETFEVFGGKNPFEKPTLRPATAPTTTVGTEPDGATTTTVPGQTTTTQPIEVQPVRNQPVALIEVFDEDGELTATVRVGSTVYRVTVGDVFEGSYQVVSLDLTTGCGVFLFGDTRFDLCEGQETLK